MGMYFPFNRSELCLTTEGRRNLIPMYDKRQRGGRISSELGLLGRGSFRTMVLLKKSLALKVFCVCFSGLASDQIQTLPARIRQ
jgi:hypothetical protein